ncbi:MAG: hypothetical protein EZS28_030570 [Streblomastix strix]|uniref:Uncharacterized protein n=1 Tax=Streblomastix strix TaxID=222440 RepID=A0A5J4UU91_9EUKA|nr:MAG: hypothetical protein EZS28_030570 [Streblomastix strix]
MNIWKKKMKKQIKNGDDEDYAEDEINDYDRKNRVNKVVSQVGQQCHPKSGQQDPDMHNSKATIYFLEDNEIVRIAHPAYSLDLSPSDYFLFDYLKGNLKGNFYKTPEEVVAAAEKNSLKFLHKCQNYHSTTVLPEHSM